jgi:hypothetical protein
MSTGKPFVDKVGLWTKAGSAFLVDDFNYGVRQPPQALELGSTSRKQIVGRAAEKLYSKANSIGWCFP